MKFGPVPLQDAEGAVLAHSITLDGRRLRKAHVLTRDDVDAMRRAGMSDVVVAKLSPDDLDEDAAATAIAEGVFMRGIEAKPAATGRVNLHATASGVFTVDKAAVDALNAVDPAITLATVERHAVVEAGQMVATVKIIPFAVDRAKVDAAIAAAGRAEIFAVNAFSPRPVGLIQTVLPGLKDSVLAKTARVTAERLSRSSSHIVAERRPPHETAALAAEIAAMSDGGDMLLIFGASAMSDADDVIPAAIRAAGGRVIHVGMPVDPGNLMVLGEVGGKPVIGAPGCARSPKENGFDWVLDRLMAGLDVGSGDISAMGVGGLLMEIGTRPQPREEARGAAGTDAHAVVLAAGRSSRMGGPNKLLALFSGDPLIRRTARAALESGAAGALVVTGHQAARIRAALDGLDLRFAHNPDFAAGLSGSLKAGIAALPDGAGGALVMLGDMPAVAAADLDRLMKAFRAAGGASIVRATHAGKRGNPVILPKALFSAVAQLEGDTGARHLVEGGLAPVVDVEIGEGASLDVDTREAMLRAGGVVQD
jgi:molybdenum cofactor cytidylyltransferase